MLGQCSGGNRQRALQDRVHHPPGPWRNASDLEIATATWVEFYNKTRLHGSLDRMTPAEFEAAYWESHP